MRYLVTGGAGFVGSNIVETLIADGYFVCVLDDFSSGSRSNLEHVRKQFMAITRRFPCRNSTQ